MTQKFLPYGRHAIDEDDILAVSEALRGDFLTTGPRVEEFETGFAAATGTRHAVACNSGTAALHLAVLALGIAPDEAAIVPSLTFLATANVARMAGADVVFADVDPDTGLMTAQTFAEALERAKSAGLTVKTALPVHLNGQVCDMADIAAAADKHGIALIEDACHALGAADIGATPYSRIACFSTHPVKAIATGEGGVATTADDELARRMRQLRNHGMTREAGVFVHKGMAFDGDVANPWYYEMQEIGWNYRLPDVLCALGISQLKKLDRFYRRRVEIAALYDSLLAPLAPLIRPVSHGNRPHGWHLYPVLIDFDRLGKSRAETMRQLRDQGIGTQVHYIPVHRQPYYQKLYGELSLPGADSYYARCLSLPFYPALADTDLTRVADALAALISASGKVSV